MAAETDALIEQLEITSVDETVIRAKKWQSGCAACVSPCKSDWLEQLWPKGEIELPRTWFEAPQVGLRFELQMMAAELPQMAWRAYGIPLILGLVSSSVAHAFAATDLVVFFSLCFGVAFGAGVGRLLNARSSGHECVQVRKVHSLVP